MRESPRVARDPGDSPAMDHARATTGEIALRYVQGRLDDVEAAAFEAHYVGCGECLDELETLERFDRALKGVAAEEAVRLGLLARLLRRPRLVAALSLVAVLAVGVLAGLFADARSRTRDLAHELATARAPVASPLLVRLSPLRAAAPLAEPAVTIHPRAGERWVLLALDAGGLGPGPYAATLQRPDGTVIERVADLRRGAEGEVLLALPTRSLDGVYRLELRSPAGGPSVHFDFEILRGG